MNKTFSQGVLDIDINWNEKKWYEKLEEVKTFMDENGNRPSSSSKDTNEKKLGKWISHQNTNYKDKKQIMRDEEIYDAWTDFINDENYKH